MLIPMADVPRWYAERKPKDTIAIRHGADTLTWEQLERGANRRARAFAASGVRPGDFVAIGLPNGNAFFETTFAVWKLGATPTSLVLAIAAWRSRGRARHPQAGAGGSAAKRTGMRRTRCRPISCRKVFPTNRWQARWRVTGRR